MALNDPRAQAAELLSYAASELSEFTDLARDLYALCERVWAPLKVAVAGEFSSGKSKFLNAVIEDAILPTGALPTSGCVVALQHAPEVSIIARYADGTGRSLSRTEFKAMAAHDHDNPGKREQLRTIERIDVFCPSKILEHHVFYDTPGLNAPNESDHKVTLKLLDEADVIVWLSSATQVLAGTQVDVLRKYTARYKDKSVLVISQTDLLDDPGREIPQLLAHAKRTMGDYFSDMAAVSAKAALNGNKEAVRPFYKSFWDRIVPRSRTIVSSISRASSAL